MDITNFQQLPDEIISLIYEYTFYINEQNITIYNIFKSGKQIYNLKLAFNIKSKLNLPILKKRYNMLKKYYQYNECYKYCKNNKVYNPILIDILLSGCNLPLAYSTYNSFEKEQEEDLKKCIELFPNSINSTYGILRCRTNVTPLHAACLNEKIPLHIINYLIMNGADINIPININGKNVNILNDINDNNRGNSIIKTLSCTL